MRRHLPCDDVREAGAVLQCGAAQLSTRGHQAGHGPVAPHLSAHKTSMRSQPNMRAHHEDQRHTPHWGMLCPHQTGHYTAWPRSSLQMRRGVDSCAPVCRRLGGRWPRSRRGGSPGDRRTAHTPTTYKPRLPHGTHDTSTSVARFDMEPCSLCACVPKY